jgi:hypothetical protein
MEYQPRGRPMGRPSLRQTTTERTGRRVDQRDRVTKLYMQINIALAAARSKNQHRTVRHLTTALGSVSDALDVLDRQTTKRSR